MNKVMVVDDQDDTLGEVSDLFTKNGIEVISAQDTKSAANLFFESVSTILAVLIDLKLNDPTTAERSGYELACRLRGYNRFIPIFLYSAYPIDEDIKTDSRLNGWFQKGGRRAERINIDTIQSAGHTYWDDFHRDDPVELVQLKERLGISEHDFLRLVEPKTPLRHERLIDLVLEVESNIQLDEVATNTGDWELAGISRQVIEFQDGSDTQMKLEARVSLLEKGNEGAKCMLTSLPFVFAYGENRETALKNFSRTLADMYNLVHGFKTQSDGIANKVDGADYLRLKSFFARVTGS